MSILSQSMPALMVWRKGLRQTVEFKSLRELGDFLNVKDLSLHQVENRAFRREHQISLGLAIEGLNGPFYEMDIVSMKNGELAYIWCNDNGDFVLMDKNQVENDLNEINSRPSVENYYFNKEKFSTLFPKSGY